MLSKKPVPKTVVLPEVLWFSDLGFSVCIMTSLIQYQDIPKIDWGCWVSCKW
jgi:hypothetical protein